MQSPSIILGHRFGTRPQESEGGDLLQIIGNIRRVLHFRRWLFIFPSLTGMMVTLVVALSLPHEFTLSTKFERRDDGAISKLVNKGPSKRFETIRRSMKDNLMGYDAIDRAVDQLGLTDNFVRGADGKLTSDGTYLKRQLVSDLSSALTLSLLQQSDDYDLVEVKYTGNRPDIAVKVVTQLKNNYIGTTHNWVNDSLRESQEFFEKEVEKLRTLMSAESAELMEIESTQPGLSQSQPGALDDKIRNQEDYLAQLEKDLTGKESKISKMREDLRRMNQRIDGSTASSSASDSTSLLSTYLIPNPQRLQCSNAMNNVRAEIADNVAIRGMKELHPTIVGLRRKLTQLRIEFEKLPAMIEAESENSLQNSLVLTPSTNPLVTAQLSLELELGAANKEMVLCEAEVSKAKSDLADLRGQVETLPERRRAYTIRENKLKSEMSQLSAWTRLLEEANQAMTVAVEDRGFKFTTLQEARLPNMPSSPKLSLVMALTVVGGLGLGAVLVFLREVFDSSLRHPARVRQALGIPVIETIGEIMVRPKGKLFVRHRLLPALASVQVLAILVMGCLFYLSIEQPRLYGKVMHQVSAYSAAVMAN